MSNLLFGDHLFSVTELSRQAGKVLDLALKGPVTITRGDHHFALMRRELAASLFRASSDTNQLTELLLACHQRLIGSSLEPGHDYVWMNTLDQEEAIDLVQDSLEAFRASQTSAGAWTALKDTVDRWKQGALLKP